MIRISQRSLPWAVKFLPHTKITIGAQGCAISSLSMLSDWAGHYMTPDQIAAHTDWFNENGQIIWSKVVIPGLKFEWREYVYNQAKVGQYLADSKKAVILNVNHGTHFVVALPGSKRLICADPWYGKDEDVLNVYHNVVGEVYFSKA